MNGTNFLGEIGQTLTDKQSFSLDLSQDTESQVTALTLCATQLMGATAKIGQKNLESVLLKAKDKIVYDGQEKRFDQDKVIRLIQLSTQFSSEEMQDYIAGILAGEYNQPGRFSFKTLEVVKNLGKLDIELFRKFGGIIFDGKYFFSNFYQLKSEGYLILDQEGIGYDNYLYLSELGLVLKTNSERYIGVDESDLPSKLPFTLAFKYIYTIQGKQLSLKKKGKSKLTFSSLTTAGTELLSIIGFEKNDTLLELVKSEFIRQGFYE